MPLQSDTLRQRSMPGPATTDNQPPAPSHIDPRDDIAISTIQTSLAILMDGSALVSKLPFIAPAAGLLSQALTMRDEVKQYKKEYEKVTQRVARIARIIVNVGTLCADKNLSEEDIPVSLRGLLDSLRIELDSIARVLKTCSDSRLGRIKRFVLRRDLLTIIKQCDLELASALQAFSVEVTLDNRLALIASRQEVAPISGLAEELPTLLGEQNSAKPMGSSPDELPCTPEPTDLQPNIREPRCPPVHPHGGEPYSSYPPRSFQRPPPQFPTSHFRPSSTLVQPQQDVGHYQAPQPYSPVSQPYSPRIGQKKALLVGINYSKHQDHGVRLLCCIDDAKEMARFLHEHFGFHPNNIQILTDDQSNNLPKEANILAGMRWLVEGAQPGDSLFFYFSGHATQIKDNDGDKPDGFNQCMCAMDYDDQKTTPKGIIVDYTTHDTMVKPLPRGCRLTAVLDCDSGTLLDLPYIYSSNGVLKQNRPDVVRRKASEAVVISLSACENGGKAYEMRGGGALRQAFIDYMKRSGNSGTYLQVIQSLRAFMARNGLAQRPELSSSHWIDTDQRFIVTG